MEIRTSRPYSNLKPARHTRSDCYKRHPLNRAQSFVSHRIEAWKSEQETGILLTKDEADDSPPMGNRVKNVEGARLWVLKDGLRRTPIAEVRYDMVQRAECFSVSAKDSCAKPSEASPRIGDSIGYVAGDEKDLKIDAF